MTSLPRRLRPWTLLLLLYVCVDFTDPSIPGVFFLDSARLFVDGAIQVKSDALPRLATAERMPFGARADEGESAVTKARLPARPHVTNEKRWKALIRGDSASFASSSLPDSSPTSPLS